MKRNILIFGGGNNQLTLIKAARDCGYHTVVIDPMEDAPAKTIADVFEVVGVKDFEKTIEIAKKYNIEGIVTSQMENPLLLMSEVAETMGYIFPKPQHILQARNKYLMKQCFLKAGVPCAKGILVSKNTQITKDILNGFEFPLIIKPVDSYSSRGVYKVENTDQINQYINNTRCFSSTGDILIEEFMDGPEVSVESITCKGITTIFQITDKIITGYPCTVEMGHIQPSGLNESVQNEIKILVKDAINALELDNCASHAEVKITTAGVKMVEIGARLGGDYISSYLTSLSTGISLEAAAVRVAMGDIPETVPIYNNGSVIKYLELSSGKKVKAIKEWKEVLDLTGVVHALVFIKENEIIPDITDSSKRSGFVICNGTTREEAVANVEYAINKLKTFFVLE